MAMLIYAGSKIKNCNPIIIEGTHVYRDSDGMEYNKRSDLVLAVLANQSVVERKNYSGFRKAPYVACMYTSRNKDFIGRNIPITFCMRSDTSFDMTAVHTLWEERYVLSPFELNEIQQCLTAMTKKSNWGCLSMVGCILITLSALTLIAIY